LPNGARDGDFNTDNGKAHLTVNPLPKLLRKENEYTMMTIRTHDQFNTTIYGMDDRYRGIYNGRRVVLMNKEDIKKEGWKAGDFVDLYNHFGGGERVAPHFMIVKYDIPKRCMATYFPETNVIVPLNKYDKRSKCPASKNVLIMRKATEI